MGEGLSELRRRSWITRRQKYGERGHNGSYARQKSALEDRALRLLAQLHHEAVLSEGQLSKALDLDRIEVREMIDRYTPKDRP